MVVLVLAMRAARNARSTKSPVSNLGETLAAAMVAGATRAATGSDDAKPSFDEAQAQAMRPKGAKPGPRAVQP